MARRIRRSIASSALALLVLSAAAPALAHPHDEKESGHPLRIAAYLMHPFGVLLDRLIMRPAHWLGSKEPLSTIFGHEDE